ncbi:succinate dehydrogenase, cytochrome b556 subunit [Psychrobacter sp. HD31]|uniref:succinate dehydrogenase, cytochrome b556 subunit n=1 Tax=Psychrobacter sp. HD31 TaxID=3112003 RepID=UPI003DA46D73
MKNKRPINLSVGQILSVNAKSPIAMASILHRVSGLLLFVLIPVLLFVLQTSLSSPEGFASIFDNMFIRFIVWVFVAATGYHFVMGVKHLLADLGMNEELESGRRAAWISIVLAVIVILASFVWVMF